MPRARDLGTVASLAGGLLLLFVCRDLAFAPYLDFFRQGLLSAVNTTQQPSGASSASVLAVQVAGLREIIEVILLASLPALAGAVLATVLVHVVRLRGAIAWTAPGPRFDRLNPARQLHTLFSISTLIELVKSLLKAFMLLACLGLVVRMALPALVHVPRLDPSGIVATLERLLIQTLTPVLGVFVLIAVIDTWYQLEHWRRQLRMTPEELRREQRDDEGDPQLRAQARAALQSAATARDPPHESRHH